MNLSQTENNSAAEKDIEVRFEITEILYHNSNCSALLKAHFTMHSSNIAPPSKKTFIRGYFPYGLTIGDVYDGVGYWRQTITGNTQFVLTSSNLRLQSTYRAIGSFLQKVSGIGKKTAEAVVEEFGQNTFRIIKEDPQRLTIIPRISGSHAIAIKEMVDKEEHFADIATFLASRKIKYDFIAPIYEIFGAETKSALEKSPYSLTGAVKMNFKEIDQFALSFGTPIDDPERLFYGVVDGFEKEIASTGHVYLERNVLEETARDYLIKTFYEEEWRDLGLKRKDFKEKIVEKRDEIPIKAIQHTIEQLMADGKIVNDEGKFYLKRYYHYERTVVNTIEDALKENRFDPELFKDYFIKVQQYIETYEHDMKMKFAKEQKDSIFMALSNKISILTGGPGTGKTHTLKMIIESLKIKGALQLTPLLVAPTGKAAKRMSEVIDMNACTIHRAIGLRGTYSSNSNIVFTNNLVIVDETSMVDILVFAKLLTTIDFETCNLLLVGDSDQLPSVGPGLILRDLISSGRIPVTRLKKIFRQAESSEIVSNAYSIIEERPKDLRYNNKKDFFFIEKDEIGDIRGFVLKTIERLLKIGYTLPDIQVLSPMKKGPIGTEELNYSIQRAFNKTDEKVIIKKGREFAEFRVGDRVIQTKNNYDLEVFNGEVGIITEMGMAINVDFGDRIVQYIEESDIQHLELAYAITIHKSQGSEYSAVIIPIHESHNILLNKNLLYTGVTRSKSHICLVGQSHALKEACMRSDHTIRNSQIKKFLIERLPEIKTAF